MANIKKEFGIPSFTSGAYNLNTYSDELARGYLNYKNQISNQLNRMNIHGGGAVGAMRGLTDWTKQQSGLLRNAKEFTTIQAKLNDLTTQYNIAQQNYLKDKEEMQHRIPIIGGRGESESKMNANKAKMDELKTQIDQLSTTAAGYTSNPFIGQMAGQALGAKGNVENAYNQALGANYGDIGDTIARIGGGLLLGPAMGALGNFLSPLLSQGVPMIAGTPSGPLNIGMAGAGPLAGLSQPIKDIADAYSKFTGSDVVTDVSNAILSGKPLEQAVQDIMTKGTNMQLLKNLSGVMGGIEEANIVDGKISYKFKKDQPKINKVDLPNITTNDIQEGAIGKVYDIPDNDVANAQRITSTKTPTTGYMFQVANYGGYPKVVEIKVGSALSKMSKATSEDIARGTATAKDIESGKYIEKVNPNTGKVQKFKVESHDTKIDSDIMVRKVTPIIVNAKASGKSYEETKAQTLDSYGKGELNWTEYQRVQQIIDDVYGKQLDPEMQKLINMLNTPKKG